ncbi:MAG TPA: TIGR00282 family metallophosphoesterase [Spirochaetia bacterium]|nr:TIGR00282 family metallophosphoesterase [Spirochaetia bacterium]
MSIRVLFIGEIVGKAGVFCVKNLLPSIKRDKNIDFVIANAEGTTGGFGLGRNHSIYLHKLGIDVLTGGERIYYKMDMVPHIQKAPYILRPANYPPGNPGRGWRVYSVNGQKIAVICLLGQSGFTRVHLSNPYTFLPDLLSRVNQETRNVILDFHATTTAEKYTMFHLADGKVSAVIGTHTRALTADETILPGGTGVICDSGRTGSSDSVGGMEIETEIQKFLTAIPERSKDAWDGLELQGVIIDIDDNGKATSIERLRMKCEVQPDDRNGDGEEDRGDDDSGGV